MSIVPIPNKQEPQVINTFGVFLLVEHGSFACFSGCSLSEY